MKRLVNVNTNGKKNSISISPDLPMFIVTNLDAPAMQVIATYCKCGIMEDF